MFLTPQQLELLDEFSETYSRDDGILNIRFSRIYHYLKNITNTMGKGKGRPINGWPYSKRSSFISITGLMPLDILKTLYKRVNFRLPVYLKLFNYKIYNNFLMVEKTKIKIKDEKNNFFSEKKY